MIEWYNSMAHNTDELKDKPNEGNASLCINCGECIEKCPQFIDIPTEMKKINEKKSRSRHFLR